MRASIELSALSSETFFAWGNDYVNDWRRQIRAEFARLGFRPAAEKEYDQLFAIGAAVAAGQGWTIIFRDGSALIPPGTTIVPVTDFKVTLPHAMVYRADERRPVVRTVINVIRETVTEERAVRDGHIAVEVGASQMTSVAMEIDRVAPSAVLELRHLRYFCAVADAGSFGRAAEQLGLTQPALSRQVADLERVVAIPLLERVARGVSPSAAGASFNRSARRILDEVRSISGEAQRARRGMLARCVVASVPTYTARNLLTELVRECAGEQPKLEFSIEDIATPAQPAAIRSGQVDLGVCHASPLSAIEERGLERSRLMNDLVNCVLVADSSDFASRDSLSLHELARVPFIFPDRAFQPGMYDQLFKVFESLDFQPRVDDTYHGLQTIWTLVAEGHGWAIGFASQCEMPPPGTVAVPVENFSIPWGLDLLSRDDESRSLILDVADRLHRIASALT
jgi:DNA-binding transcriptional LysR family regulator